jgi:hypothetical protein
MSLDVARKAAATLQAIGDVVGLTREWVRQISIDQCEGIISESHTLRPPSHDHDRLEKALEEGLRETFPASDAVACSSARTTRTAQGTIPHGPFVDQPVLPFAGITFLPDRRIERQVTAETAVHVDHVLLGHPEPPGNDLDLVGPQLR